MTTLVTLNNIDHKDLIIDTGLSADYGHNTGYVLAFPTEFSDLQREYPIFFQKNPDTHQYCSVALLGMRSDENLFLNGNQWNADYVPAIVAKGPFLIGIEDQSLSGGDENALVVMLDMDDPRVNSATGEAVFLEYGGNTPYLEGVNHILQRIYQGDQISHAMFAAFEQLDLIEPVELEIQLNNNEIHRLHGNYTISREKLYSLRGESLENLHRSGFLEAAFLVLNSLNNVKKLIDIKNTMC